MYFTGCMSGHCNAIPTYHGKKTLNHTNLLSSSEELNRFVWSKVSFPDTMNGPFYPRKDTQVNYAFLITKTQRAKKFRHAPM
jgi:hypothetical protein